MVLPFAFPVTTSLQNLNLFVVLKYIKGGMVNMIQLCSSPKWTEFGDRISRCGLSHNASLKRWQCLSVHTEINWPSYGDVTLDLRISFFFFFLLIFVKYFVTVRTHCVSGNGQYAVGKAKIDEDMFPALGVAWSREKRELALKFGIPQVQAKLHQSLAEQQVTYHPPVPISSTLKLEK